MIRLFIPAALLVLLVAGCQTAYYSFWETLGKEKRHLLKQEVQKATEEQEQATQQFKDVLTRMKEMYGFKGGDLEQFYNKLKADYEESEERAEAVRKRIDNVEQIASDLFKEWEKEISEISNPNLKTKSSNSLRSTKERYARLHKAMNRAEESMDPVLKKLKDYVLYLKHNLNAQAVGALKQEGGDIEVEVKKLIGDMGTSIKEAEDFLSTFES